MGGRLIRGSAKINMGGVVSSAGSGYKDVDREGAEGLPAADTRNGGGRLTSYLCRECKEGRKERCA